MASTIRLLPVLRRTAVIRPSVWKCGARRTFVARSSLFVKKYTEDHEWVELDEGGKIGTFGITEYAAKALGDVVYVELPEEGAEVKQGDAVGAVESVKSASDIFAPIAGTVLETNKLLEEKPGHINREPEGEAWLAKLEIADSSQLEKLLSKEEYDNLEKDGDH